MTPPGIWRWLWSRAWIVLVYMTFVSGVNGVAARLVRNEMPPLLLVFLRWFIVCLTLVAILKSHERRELMGLLRHHWRRLAWMGGLGYTAFNALFYVAAYHTSGVNLSLIQSAIPALVLAGAALVFGTRIRLMQIAGLILTCLGVLVVVSKGDLSRLASVHLDRGDGLVLIACFFYAAYTLGLRARPAGTPLVFFAGVAIAALVWSLPLAAAEVFAGESFRPSPTGWLITLFIAFGPSFTGQLCWMRGVDLIGPARAGLYGNLIPIFGAVCAVVMLREPFTAAHATALALGFGGIALAEWKHPAREAPSAKSGEAASDAALP